jgi:hypothetical protein
MPHITEEEIIKRHKVSKSSAKLYIRNYETLLKKMDEDDMKDPEKVLEVIDNLKPNTQRAYLLSMMRVLKLDEDEMNEMGKAYVKLTREIDEKRETTSRDVPDVDFSRKLRMINDQIKETRSESKLEQLLQDKLVILIHSEIPARRGMDYYDMEIVGEPTDDILEDDEMDNNYYNMRDFIFKKFKSSKKHGSQTLKPTKRIKKTIRMLLQVRGEEIGDYLFVNRKGKKFTNPSWNKMLKRVIGYGTNDLRKIYAKQNIDTDAVKKAIKLAKEMGHTIETAEKDYYERDGERDTDNTRTETA